VTIVQYGVLGLAGGAMYALLAVGIVLVYRATGVLNFAHASMGMVCAYVDFELIERYHMPVAAALVIALAVGAGLGVAVHECVFRPMASAPQVVRLLASFGLAGVLQGAVGLVWSRLGTPNPFGHSLFPVGQGLHVAGVVVPWQRVAIIVAGLAVSVVLTLVVTRTDFGVQLRALAQNPLAARLAGVDDRRIQRRVWAIAGASAGLAGVLIIPFGALNPLSLNGFELQALAASVVGGFASLPAALLGGIGIGVVQELLLAAPAPINGLRSAIASLVVLALLLVGVERFFVSSQEARALEGDDRPAASAARAVVLGRPTTWFLGAAAAACVVATLSGFWAFVVSRTLVYALLALSLVVLTGWSGEVSVMPGTFAGVGACLSWVLGSRFGYPMPLVLPVAAVATVPVCAVVGIVALRLRPLYVAVATISLAGLFEQTLFRQDWFANGGAAMTVDRPSLVRGDRAFALAVLALSVCVFAFVAAVGRARTGRAMWMVRDNPRAAAAGGVNPVKYRLLAFSLSAAIAGLAGAVFAYLLGTFNTETFGFLVLSLAVFGLAIVGGIRSPLGAAVGAFLFVYVTEVFRTAGSVSDWTSVAVGVGIVVVLSRTPDGVVGALQRSVRAVRTAGAGRA
jgi:branched-subunit amino acid ABC-type transport system permease component